MGATQKSYFYKAIFSSHSRTIYLILKLNRKAYRYSIKTLHLHILN